METVFLPWRAQKLLKLKADNGDIKCANWLTKKNVCVCSLFIISAYKSSLLIYDANTPPIKQKQKQAKTKTRNYSVIHLQSLSLLIFDCNNHI